MYKHGICVYVQKCVDLMIDIFRTKLELLCYIRTEFDPLCITFDICDDNIIHSVEQKVSRKVIVV